MKKLLLLIIVAFTFCNLLAQQQITITLLDSVSKEPLIAASVVQMGTNNGAISNENGIATLTVISNEKNEIQAKYLGYANKNMLVTNASNQYTIYLVPLGSDLSEINISSIRTNSRIEAIPTRVEVLGLEEMNEEGGIKPSNIMSLLGDIAGIQMQQTSASSGNTFARMQGLSGKYTQLLQDGLPLYGGLSGNLSMMQIPPLNLKQIEIIKGAVSTLYGGDAIGGIINLISKEPSTSQELSLTANYTTLSEKNMNVYLAKKYKKIGYTFFAGQTFQHAVDLDKDGLSESPLVKTTFIHPKLFFYLNPKSTISLNYTAILDTRGGGNMNYFKNNTDSIYHIINTNNRNNVDIKFTYQFSKTRNLNIKSCYSNAQNLTDTRLYDFTGKQNTYYSEVSYFQKNKKTDWVIGLNFNGDEFTNTSIQKNYVPNYKYNTLGSFIQNTYNPIPAFTIESGFRLDYHSFFGLIPMPRLALMYKFNTAWSARVNGGMGYKVPTVVNYINLETDVPLFASNKFTYEQAKGINADINFHKVLGKKINTTFNQSFFYTRFKNPVIMDMHKYPIYLINATNPINTLGFQSYVRLQIDPFEIYFGYVNTQVKKLYDEQHTTPIVTPKHNFSTVLFYEINEDFKVGLESSYIMNQLQEDYTKAKNYLIMAAMAQYTYKKFTFVLNGENLLNIRQYHYSSIYYGSSYNPIYKALYAPIDGRVINLSIKYQL